ncbi:tail fiber domain-containing protein [uncultured Microscilla sp.]|uniref:tail fiber domain-containing protein n=1 Tax=uncultured Microscilla sp. TaxID=432653 RepID=UPI002604369B|nr:tail fiber domain-containing protein [uncultured Microscilla sp.]
MNFQTLFNNTTTKRDTLKPAFNVGEIPTQQHFYDMIDGLFLQDDTVYKDANNGLAIQAGTDTDQTALLLYADATSEPAWQLGIANGFELKDTAGNTQWMVTNDGKVGIGTTNPTGQLHLSLNDNEINIESTPTDSQITIQNTSTTDGNFSAIYFGNSLGQTSTSIASVNVNADGQYGSSNPRHGELRFMTADPGDLGSVATRMTIKGNGNVGIGTTSPEAPLDILVAANQGAEEMLRIKLGDASPDYFKIMNMTSTAGQFMPSVFAHHETDDREALFLVGSITAAVDTGTSPIMHFEARTEAAPYTVPESSTRPLFAWGSYNAKKMVMMANGAVGIGTTTPDYKLDIYSPTEAWLRVQNGNNANNAGIILQKSSISWQIYNRYDDKLDFWSTSVGSALTITSSGNVGIGSHSPGHKLEVQGTVASFGTPLSSDVRFKQDIVPITAEAITKLKQLQGSSFRWRTKEFKDKSFSEGTQLGFIAQEVQEVYPELVEEGTGGYLLINYTGLIPVLTEAHKQQQQTIEDQQAQIDSLVARMVALENMLAAAKS